MTIADFVSIKATCKELYFGSSRRAILWRRCGLLAFDCAAVLTFFIAPYLRQASDGEQFFIWLFLFEIAVGVFLLTDIIVRLWISGDNLRYMLRLWSVVDLAVIVSLVAPGVINFGFPRILRVAWFVRSLRSHDKILFEQKQLNYGEEIFFNSLYLFSFIIVILEMVYSTQVNINDSIVN